MTEGTDTQTISGEDLSNVLSGVFRTGAPAAAQAAAADAAATSEQPQAQAKPPEEPAAEPAQGQATNVDASGIDYGAIVNSAIGAPEEVIQWDEPAKELFKKTFGQEDPVAFKSAIDQQLTESKLWKQKYEEVAPLKEKFESLSPALMRAMQLAMEGKVADAQSYLKSMPASVLEDKPASSLNERQLIDTYLPGKISDEQWNALNDPEEDEDVKSAIRTRIDILKEGAADLHEKRRNEVRDTWSQQQEASKKAYDEFQKGIATAISNVNQSPLKVLADEPFVRSIQDGGFMNLFVREDGVTPTPDAGTLVLKALHFDSVVKAAESRGYERGKQAALLEATSRQPSAPTSATRSPGVNPAAGGQSAVPAANQNQSPEMQILAQVLTS